MVATVELSMSETKSFPNKFIKIKEKYKILSSIPKEFERQMSFTIETSKVEAG